MGVNNVITSDSRIDKATAAFPRLCKDASGALWWDMQHTFLTGIDQYRKTFALPN
jgi:hypothetical protein